MSVYIDFVNQSTVYYVDNEIIKETIRIRKNYRIKIPGAFIAATALVNKLTLIADNDKDSLKISSLKYINPNKI